MKRQTNSRKVVIKGSQLTEEVILVSKFRVNTVLRVTICPVSCCIGRILNRSLIQCKTATVNFISTVQCDNQGTMTKVQNSVVRLCCYSYSDYCLKATAP